jgi:hypothetical protein
MPIIAGGSPRFSLIGAHSKRHHRSLKSQRRNNGRGGGLSDDSGLHVQIVFYVPNTRSLCAKCTGDKVEDIDRHATILKNGLIGFQPQIGSEMELNYGMFALGFVFVQLFHSLIINIGNSV